MPNSPITRQQLIELLLPSLRELLSTPQARAVGAPADPARLAELLTHGLAERLERTAAAHARTESRPDMLAPEPEARIRQLLESAPDQRFTLDEVATYAGLPRETASACVSSLVQAGSVVRDGYFIRLPGPEDELPPRDWDADPDQRGGPDRRTETPDRRGLGDRRLFDRRQS